MARRVAITGLGVLSPLGNQVDEVVARLIAGKSGIRCLTTSRCERLRSPIGAPVDFDNTVHFDAVRCRMLDRVSQLALIAAAQAIGDARIDFASESLERCVGGLQHGGRCDHGRGLLQSLWRGFRARTALEYFGRHE